MLHQGDDFGVFMGTRESYQIRRCKIQIFELKIKRRQKVLKIAQNRATARIESKNFGLFHNFKKKKILFENRLKKIKLKIKR